MKYNNWLDRLEWKPILKSALCIMFIASFILSACTNLNEIETDSQNNDVPVTDSQNNDVPEAADPEDDPVTGTELPESDEERLDEIFNRNKYADKLTIRYFHMEGENKTGDSMLLLTPDGKSMLIDAGLPDVGNQVVDYLDKLDINTLDAILNTHPHIDHLGGYPTILASKDAKKVYMQNLPRTTKSYQNSVDAINNKNIPITYLEEGSTFTLGEHVKAEVLSPPKGILDGKHVDYTTAEYNSLSLVVKFTYKDHAFIFPGDIYRDKEYELVDEKEAELDADFVHAPHHGGKSSSSGRFVNAVKPKVAVMSANKFQSFDVYKRYEQAGAEIVGVAMHGNILVISDGYEEMKVITEKDWEWPLD